MRIYSTHNFEYENVPERHHKHYIMNTFAHARNVRNTRGYIENLYYFASLMMYTEAMPKASLMHHLASILQIMEQAQRSTA